MTRSDELAYTTATELAARIRRRELSPVEVVDATIERIEQRNDDLNAFVFRGFDDAREAAREAERKVTAGEELGPLHGVPTAIKDLFDFKPGWPSTFGGVRALAGFVPDFYCAFAERIERAGAIIVGKTNSPVMGFRGTCDNPMFGPSRNPFDVSKNTGGSSGGSAAAVADGLLTFAEGTDGGGSIRIPAAWCGCYGYKASFGRIPVFQRPNGFGLVNPFIHEGPITRTVEDAALALNALAGRDPRDPFSIDDPVDFTAAVHRPVDGLRIAYTPDWGVFPIDPRVRDTVDNAVRAFEDAGAHVDEVKLGITRDQRELSDLWCRMIMPINVETFENIKAAGLDLLADHRDDFPPQYLRWIDEGYRLSAIDIFRDQQMRTEVYDAIEELLVDHDVIVGPTLCAMPVDNSDDGNTVGPSEVNGEPVDELIGWCPPYLINYTGHPAASIPAGLADNLPVGMQIVGRRYADAEVLAASAAFERIRPWSDIYRIPQERTV